MRARKIDPVIDAGIWKRVAIVIAIVILVALVMIAGAKAQTTLPEIFVSPPDLPPKSVLGAGQKGSRDGEAGNDGKADGNQSLKEINEQLRRKTDETNPVLNTPPLDAHSPDTKTGIVNIPGVQQQYGLNFGHSATPFRPPPSTFNTPLGRR
ncbi:MULTISPECIES: hypothetical protein [Afipia]|uniref:Uncharacterized protein n=1 Tax=Afipia massiliensis TaxID=211460 RepID=A0A840MVS1_9BRAD|nr:MULTISPECIES: hypothetical protein [Afipia]MBB5051845.1 hypothetical protein [Afipia massiliensis]